MTINSDAPIRAKDEDRLGYLPFARALAQAVAGRASGDGFVIGVQAAWGMGKSSAINLALEAIEDLESGRPEKTRVRHFNPWLFSGLEALVRGYLSELGRVIDETVDQGTPQSTRKVVEKLVRGGAEMAGGAAALAALVLSGGAAGPWAGSIKSGVTGALNLGAHVLDNRSLDSMVEALREHLRGIEGRLLVVVDDLDRLQPDELRQILTLVKTFGNLPNVIHLIVYDRTIVDGALGSATPGQPSFREKIVQVELDLPPPDRAGLRTMTFDRLIAVIGPEPPMGREDWWEVTQLAFSQYLRTPRDAVRLTNALSVAWPSVQGEVYVPDFVAIELLRHFERATYDALRSNGPLLTGQTTFLDEEGRKASGRRIAETVPEIRRDPVVSLLARIFPKARDLLSDAFTMPHPRPPDLSGRRVGDRRGFDAYFGFSVSSSEIAVADLRLLAESIDDQETLRERLRLALNGRRPDGSSFAGQLMEELSSLIDPRKEVPIDLLRILLELGDDIIEARDEANEFFLVDNRWRLRRLMEKLVERSSRGGRAQMLEALLVSPQSSLQASALVVGEIGQDHGLVWDRSDDPRSEPLLTEAETRSIGKAFASRIASDAERGELSTRPVIGVVLRVWSSFGGSESARQFLLSRLDDVRSSLDLAFATMSEISASSEPYRYRKLQRLPAEDIYDVSAMADALEGHLAADDVPADEREDARRFVRDARRLLAMRAQGETTPVMPLDDDDD